MKNTKTNPIEKAKSVKVNVKQNADDPTESLDVIASALIDVAAAFKRLNDSKLKRRAIILLLQDMTKLPQRDIEAVLDAAPRLVEVYTKP